MQDVLGIFVRAVFASLRRRARAHWGIARFQGGAVTFVQRFGAALNLNVHFHSLVLDGVYARTPGGFLRFHALPPPEDAEVASVATQVARRIQRLRERRGLTEGAEPDRLAEEEPLLAALYAASVGGRIATGQRAGQRVRRLGDRIDAGDLEVLEGERCASVGGVSLHANVAVPARDRRRLERLCRYVARPPVATERLSQLADGTLLYRLKHHWRDGTTHVVYMPQELLEKLAALVPPPRFHLARHHGILGPCASERDRVVPAGAESSRPTVPCSGSAAMEEPTLQPRTGPSASRPASPPPEPLQEEGTPAPTPMARLRRLAWAELMQRVFALDVLECPRCHGRMRLVAAIHPPEATTAILDCLGLPARAPPPDPARPDPETDWDG